MVPNTVHSADLLDINEQREKIITEIDRVILKILNRTIDAETGLTELLEIFTNDTREILGEDLKATLNRAAQTASAEIKCTPRIIKDSALSSVSGLFDFLDRGKKGTKFPVSVCTASPDYIAYERVKSGKLSTLNLSGYNLDAEDVQFYLLDIGSKRRNVSDYVSTPSHMLAVVNLGANGIGAMITQNDDYIIAVQGDKQLSSVPIVVKNIPDPKPIWPRHFEFTLKTCNVKDAGTGANVYMKFIGDKHHSVNHQLEITGVNDREKNSLDVYRIDQAIDFGELLQIEIWHDNAGRKGGWCLEWAKLVDKATGEEKMFPCNRWLAESHGDRKLGRTLVENASCS